MGVKNNWGYQLLWAMNIIDAEMENGWGSENLKHFGGVLRKN